MYDIATKHSLQQQKLHTKNTKDNKMKQHKKTPYNTENENHMGKNIFYNKTSDKEQKAKRQTE